MKHAGPAALERLESVLRELRKVAPLKEKSRGVFYHRGRAFLHFHEDGNEFYADVRFGDDFERLPVSNANDRKIFLDRVKEALKC